MISPLVIIITRGRNNNYPPCKSFHSLYSIVSSSIMYKIVHSLHHFYLFSKTFPFLPRIPFSAAAENSDRFSRLLGPIVSCRYRTSAPREFLCWKKLRHWKHGHNRCLCEFFAGLKPNSILSAIILPNSLRKYPSIN